MRNFVLGIVVTILVLLIGSLGAIPGRGEYALCRRSSRLSELRAIGIECRA